MGKEEVFNKIIFEKYFARYYCFEYIDFAQNQVDQKSSKVSSWPKGYLTLDEFVPPYLKQFFFIIPEHSEMFNSNFTPVLQFSIGIRWWKVPFAASAQAQITHLISWLDFADSNSVL